MHFTSTSLKIDTIVRHNAWESFDDSIHGDGEFGINIIADQRCPLMVDTTIENEERVNQIGSPSRQ